MTANWFLRLSDWNPQFFRELKGRLKPRNVTLTAITSLMTQLVVLLYFWTALPSRATIYSNRYFIGSDRYMRPPVFDVLGNPLIDWKRWWLDIFQVFAWVLPFVLLIAGVYMLIGDLAKEERRGTLNFIRLSPQSSQRILIGKLLGVPAIAYLAVALAIPLHLIAAVGAGIPLKIVFSIYLVTIAGCGFLYTGALLYAFLGGFQGWVGAVAVWFCYTVFFQFWYMAHNLGKSSYLGPIKDWFYLPVDSYLSLAVPFVVATLGGGTYWIWQVLNRRFRNPNVTLLSKKQSYLVTACLELWMLGFVFRENNYFYTEYLFIDLVLLAFCNLIWFVLLIAALTPQRQMLLDWARYRRERVRSAKQFWSRSIVNDLVWGEKSPSLVAISINLMIPLSILALWLTTWPASASPLRLFAMLVLGATFLLICTAVAQLIMFMKSAKRTIWAAGAISMLILLPPIVLTMLTIYPHQVPAAWLFTAFAFAAFSNASATTVFFSLLGHLSIFTMLAMRMTKQLRKAGESESKALLAGSRS